MTENGKRNLRERRGRKSYNSDNEDFDPNGNKRRRCNQDTSKASDAKSDAKTLVEFIKTINQKFKEHQLEQLKKINQKIPVRDRRAQEPEPTQELQRREAQEVGPVKTGKTPKSGEQHNLKTEKILEKDRNEKKSEEASICMPAIEPQNVKVHENEKSKNNELLIKGEDKFNQTNQVQQKLDLSKSEANNNKIQKRAAFHVVTTLNIYNKNLQEKGENVRDPDPTLNSQRFKEEARRNL